MQNNTVLNIKNEESTGSWTKPYRLIYLSVFTDDSPCNNSKDYWLYTCISVAIFRWKFTLQQCQRLLAEHIHISGDIPLYTDDLPCNNAKDFCMAVHIQFSGGISLHTDNLPYNNSKDYCFFQRQKSATSLSVSVPGNSGIQLLLKSTMLPSRKE